MDLRSLSTTTTITLDLTKKEFLEIKYAIQSEDLAFLQAYVKATNNKLRGINLSKDPLLNVMIACDSKDAILLKLINMMTPDALWATNMVGDTALHVAAAKDRMAVVTALIENNHKLIDARNKNRETPLLKAAHFGSAKTFNYLLRKESDIEARNKSGFNVLHCAILSNNPDLALQIAQQYPNLMLRRNDMGLTPLQLMVTIPEGFRSSLELGPAESLIYAIIPLNSHNESKKLGKERDEEAPFKSTGSKQSKYWIEDDKDNAEDDKFLKESKAKSSKKFLENCQHYVTKGAFQVRLSIIEILKKLFERVKKLEEQKTKHAQTMKLIAYLARDPGYWEFIQYGMFGQHKKNIVERSMSFSNEIDDDDDSDDENPPFDSSDESTTSLQNENDSSDENTTSPQNEKIPSCCLEIKNLISEQTNLIKEQKNLISEQTNLISEQKNLISKQNNLFEESKNKIIESKEGPEQQKWNESPLIVGVKMGLHDYVEQILKARPQSAEIKDLDGRNVLQVAIKCGHIEIVKIIAKMTKGPNPMLPSWLLSDVKGDITDDETKEDDEKKNTILHYAAGTTIRSEGLALQMRHEIKWFEMVKELLPKDMVYSRNINEKTAQELFDENHDEMVKSGKNQLMEIGKTCSGLLAAVVFATSFNMPGSKDSDNSTKNNMTKTEGNHFSNEESVGFKVFTHAYMIGLSSATCSLILFLSLLTSNYSPEAFRKSLPTRCLLAGGSFLCALMALLVAFLSNAYLTIYGGGKPNAEDLLQLILELIGFPILWAVVWFFGGFGTGFLDFILKKFRR
ncbi:Caskin/Ankyrin repeat-containing protein [Dioscorea alata]|uniref:Caskin/Ankyrin repeat-containing protein n=1 Tax=Dioscorea alata TaxID=55571 RepID=A0ACB7WHN3_DIOAL|nr:Caskin/Ankyrin repeat-containing protein [Dioscorea alata]